MYTLDFLGQCNSYMLYVRTYNFKYCTYCIHISRCPHLMRWVTIFHFTAFSQLIYYFTEISVKFNNISLVPKVREGDGFTKQWKNEKAVLSCVWLYLKPKKNQNSDLTEQLLVLILFWDTNNLFSWLIFSLFQLTLIVQHLPELNAGNSYTCIYGEWGYQSEAQKVGNRLTCESPPASRIPRVVHGGIV